MAFLQINLTYFRFLALFFAAHTSQIYVWVLPLMLKPLNRVCTFVLGYLFVVFACFMFLCSFFQWRILHFLRTYLPSHWLFSQPLFQLRLLGHTLLRFPIRGHSDIKVCSKTTCTKLKTDSVPRPCA